MQTPVRTPLHPSARRVQALHPYVSQICRFHDLTSFRNLRGFPSSPTPLFLHATACGLRRTSTPKPFRVLRVVFQHVKTVDIRNKLISKLYQHFRVLDHPYGLQDALCTLTPHIVHRLPRSSLRSTLDTGGWLALTRRGLAPRKRRRVLLGAITLRAEQREALSRSDPAVQ